MNIDGGYMDESDKKSFFRWLDQATDLEIQSRLMSLEAVGFRLTEPEVIQEYRWQRKMFLSEIDARFQVKLVLS